MPVTNSMVEAAKIYIENAGQGPASISAIGRLDAEIYEQTQGSFHASTRLLRKVFLCISNPEKKIQEHRQNQ